MREPRFFVDAMLGNVARKLRLLGYDATYDSGMDDNTIIKAAEYESRIIVTKDRELARRCKKISQGVILVCGSKESGQIAEICKNVPLRLKIDSGTARCTRCNHPTEPASMAQVASLLPAGVLERQRKFWRCVKCGQVYWDGTHIRNLQSFVGEVHAGLA